MVRVFDVSKLHIATIFRVDVIKVPWQSQGKGRAGALSGPRRTTLTSTYSLCGSLGPEAYVTRA
jgi:hypothetical protein